MNDFLRMVLISMAGVMLGLFFYGGLWWTVKKTLSTSHPALCVFTSMLLRMSVALTGIYFVTGAQLTPLLVCLAGFFIARIVVTRLTRLPQENVKNTEAIHAP
jgi:F1F0 ATPase subunit 2